MKLVILLTALVSAVSAVSRPPGFPFRGVELKPPVARRDAGGVLEAWLDQKLDHYDPTLTTTWKQRYFVNTKYYNPGGPVFLFIDGEWEATGTWLLGGNMMELVAEHGAIAFELEHRYYGNSRPTKDLTTENLVYLSTEQALTDLAYFIQAMNDKYSLTDTKWIVYGGSYAGNLAAWARLKFPHLIHGAIASSAPVLAENNFTGYFEVVGDVMQRSTPGCYEAVKTAAGELNELVKTEEGAHTVSKLFNLCNPLDINFVDDVYTLQYSYAGWFASAAQYDTYTAEETGDLCQQVLNLENGATPLERYANLVELSSCQTQNFESMLWYYSNVSWAGFATYRAWLYQTCTEYGYYQTSDSANQPFYGFPLQFYLDLCINVFGDSFNKERVDQGVTRTNILYGGLHPELSNVLFVHGSADPWHVLGVLKDLSPSVQAIVIKDFSHCTDMYSPKDNDPPQLKAAHDKIARVVREWVHQ